MDLSVAMIARNRWDLTKKAIDSVYATVPEEISWEFLFVDNHSTDKTEKGLKKYKDIKVIRTAKNIGYLANNINLKRAKGEYILLLDNDAEIRKGDIDWFYRFRFILLDKKNVAIVGPAIDSSSRWQTIPVDENGNSLTAGVNTGIPHLLGCAWFFHNSLLGEIGYIDKNLDFGIDDTDYCLRVKEAGRDLAVDYSTMWHHEKGTTPLTKEERKKQIECVKYLWRKWGQTVEKLFGKCPYE